VSSYVQLLEQRYADALDDRARKYIAYAVEGASRMQRLINDLLDFSRLQRAEVRRQAVDMDRVVENALANLQQQISESGARVEVEGPLPPVLGDEILLMRVVQNLVDNAIRYGGVEAPSVRISAAREADRWRFSVADQGAGIDPRFHERIFQVFQRLQGRDKTSGTGIGLAVVKKIVEQLGGKVRVESAPGQGATFHFTLSPKGES
jgi:light-regulated signal transduction histidine kinase (bacteriophytochrome)